VGIDSCDGTGSIRDPSGAYFVIFAIRKVNFASSEIELEEG
jgi:hypothetical protein